MRIRLNWGGIFAHLLALTVITVCVVAFIDHLPS